MMEYVYFDFNPFEIDKKVSSLRDLLVFIDEQQLADTFSNFQVRIAQDIAHGLAFLHDNDIAHRDLKPDNILVANEYYAQLTNEDERCKIFSECPIKAKLADFGESRATHLQTQTVVRSRTSRIDRGTPVYMPPEVHLKQNTESTIEDMKNADVWSFGMTLHCLINPGIDHPYSYNCSEIGRKLTLKTLIEYVKDEKLPKHEPKYEYLRVLEWWQINEVLLACLSFDSNCRPSASEMETLLSASQSYDASLTFYPLSVSQSTALEEADKKLAQKIGSIFKEPQLQHVATPENDGTNACAFIALAICNWFLGTETTVDWLEMKVVSENLITSVPFLVNDSRDVHEAYEPLSAYEVLRKKSMVSESQLSEEFINDFTVFTEAGKDALAKTH